jgi:hypothetical protein
MRQALPVFLFAAGVAASLNAAEKYNGPRPPKQDVLYLVHADNLIETETAKAQEETKKSDTTYSIPGANSSARTPLAEPIFLIDADKISPERLELYRLDARNGRREITLSGRRSKNGGRPIHTTVTPLGNHLYRVEAAEMLENGEYVLTPSGSNQVFCFEVY